MWKFSLFFLYLLLPFFPDANTANSGKNMNDKLLKYDVILKSNGLSTDSCERSEAACPRKPDVRILPGIFEGELECPQGIQGENPTCETVIDFDINYLHSGLTEYTLSTLIEYRCDQGFVGRVFQWSEFIVDISCSEAAQVQITDNLLGLVYNLSTTEGQINIILKAQVGYSLFKYSLYSA